MAEYLLRAPDTAMQEWREAAEKEGVSLAEWLRAAASVRAGGVGSPAVTSDTEHVSSGDLVRAPADVSAKKTFRPDPKGR